MARKRQRISALAGLAILSGSFMPIYGNPTVNSSQTKPTTATESRSSQHGPEQAPWLVRDPRTGRLYQQQVVNVSVPTVHWETKQVTQTVLAPRFVTREVPVQQTVYTPRTQMVLQPSLRGWWNPFRQTTAYVARPVTSWVASTTTVNQKVTQQEWAPQQRSVTVQQPVTRMQTQQQIVQTEIPQPSHVTPAVSQASYSARQPLFRLPILARQRMLPWQPIGSSQAFQQSSFIQPNYAAASSSSAPATTYPNRFNNSGLRPIAAASNAIATMQSSNYTAPLRTATTNSTSSTAYGRDPMQSGMSATVLR